MLLAPLVVHMKGEHKDLLDDARKNGFVRVRVDGDHGVVTRLDRR